MTHLRQTCADMVESQDNLQRLHSYDRAGLAGKFKTMPDVVAGLRRERVIQEIEMARCVRTLASIPAANDPAPPEGRAA